MDTRKSQRRALLVLLLITLIMVAMVVRPLAEAVVLGAVLAAVLWPLQRWLSRVIGHRPTPAAILVILGLVLLVLGPIVAMSTFVVQQATEGIAFVTSVLRSEGMESLIGRLPDAIAEPLLRWSNSVESPLDQIGRSLAGAMSTVTATIVATGSFAYQTVMMLIALFFFLTNKDDAITWLDDASPLEERQTRELFAEIRNVAVSIARSTVLTAGVQSIVALIGYLIAGVPYWAFFTGVTFFVALIPAVGAAAVCLAIAAILLAMGKTVAAIFLAAWGLLVVGLSDNLVKPLLIRHGIHMNGIVVLFALLGGLGAFGAIGLLLGPLAVAVFLAVLRIYRRDYGGEVPGGGTVATEPDKPGTP